MPRLLPSPKTVLVLAPIAVLAVAGVAAHVTLARGDSFASCSGQQARSAFELCGDLPRRLAPGTSQPLDMLISNSTRHRLRITRITVSLTLDPAHRRTGCSAARSFRVTGLAAGQYPILAPPRSTRSLRALGVRPLPRVHMLDLPAAQDACKGAELRLRFQGKGRRWHRIG